MPRKDPRIARAAKRNRQLAAITRKIESARRAEERARVKVDALRRKRAALAVKRL